MWFRQFTSLFLVLRFTYLSQALPGLQAHGCADKINGVYQDSCNDTISTTSDPVVTMSTINHSSTITSAPSIIVQAYRRHADTITALCNSQECSVFDVSSILITVFPLPDVTSRPRPPFANGTETTQPHPGPTASGTGIVSGTGVLETSSNEIDGTTTITSRVTMSVFTMTAGNWSDWTSVPMGTGATGPQPYNSANATNSPHSIPASHWSVWPMSTGSPQRPSSVPDNSTYVSSGQTSTRAPINPPSSSCSFNETTCSTTNTSVSYVTTNTYIFSGSTVVIPIPAGYASTTTSHSTKTHTPKHTSSSLVSERVSTSSCWTTTGKSVSGTNTATMAHSSKICWILSCDNDDNCTDHISRYPVTVDAQSTSAMASYTNSTAMATTTMSSNDSVLATVTSGSSRDTTWMTWSTGQNATTKRSSSSSYSRSISSSAHSTSTTHTRSVDATSISSPSSSAFESTYPSWMGWTSTTDISTATDTGTMSIQSFTSNDPMAYPNMSVDGTVTRTVLPLPATGTSESAFHDRGAMMNRKRHLRDQKHRGGFGAQGVGETEEGNTPV